MVSKLKNILMDENVIEILYNLANNGRISDVDSSLANLRMPAIPGVYHKDVLIHSIKVLENAINREDNGPDLVLRTAALFHDIGKPATRKASNNGKTVTFDGHETVGAQMMKKILTKHNYSKNEITMISELVRNHMRSYGFSEENWTDSAIRSIYNSVSSSEQFNRLTTIFYSDVTTKNNNLRNKIHSGIDVLRDNVDRILKEDARKSLRPALNGNEVMEIFNLAPGIELGKIMKFLNSDEGVYLSRDDAVEIVTCKFFGKD